MNVGEEKDMKNVPEKKEMVNTSKVNDVVNATVMAQIMNMDLINLLKPSAEKCVKPCICTKPVSMHRFFSA